MSVNTDTRAYQRFTFCTIDGNTTTIIMCILTLFSLNAHRIYYYYYYYYTRYASTRCPHYATIQLFNEQKRSTTRPPPHCTLRFTRSSTVKDTRHILLLLLLLWIARLQTDGVDLLETIFENIIMIFLEIDINGRVGWNIACSARNAPLLGNGFRRSAGTSSTKGRRYRGRFECWEITGWTRSRCGKLGILVGGSLRFSRARK